VSQSVSHIMFSLRYKNVSSVFVIFFALRSASLNNLELNHVAWTLNL